MKDYVANPIPETSFGVFAPSSVKSMYICIYLYIVSLDEGFWDRLAHTGSYGTGFQISARRNDIYIYTYI